MKKLGLLFFIVVVFLSGISFAANSPTIQNVNSDTGLVINMEKPIYVTGDTITTAIKITSSPCVIKYIYWYNPTTAAHLLAVKDADGNMLFPMYAVVAHQGLSSGLTNIPAINGIYIDDLDSGSVLIIIEKQ